MNPRVHVRNRVHKCDSADHSGWSSGCGSGRSRRQERNATAVAVSMTWGNARISTSADRSCSSRFEEGANALLGPGGDAGGRHPLIAVVPHSALNTGLAHHVMDIRGVQNQQHVTLSGSPEVW